MPVPVRVDGELEIRLGDVPEMALEQIKGALTIVNEDREKAAKLNQHGWWDLDETIALWRIEARRGGDEMLCLPRGFSEALVAGLAGLGLEVEWDDRRTLAPAAPGYFRPFLMRDYQAWACADLMLHEQGFYKCPAGGGKTVAALGTMAAMQQRTLVIVDKAGLLEQWRVRAAQFFDFPTELDDDGHEVAPVSGDRCAGKIGGGVWEERELTVCLRQTLHERAVFLKSTGWWKQWGAVWFDEGHHLSAETLGDICREVTAKYLFAVSATPTKSVAKGQIVHALVGPIVHETDRETLYARKVLMKPRVEVLSGDFYADFWPDHTSGPGGQCEVPGCNKKSKHSHRNNYVSVLKKLVEDQTRNARIARRIMVDRGHVHLVPSRQLKHLNLIRRELLDLGWPEDRIWMLRGEENAAGLDQKIVQQVMAADEGVILSTVADEALDIPPIDRVHLPFPGRDRGATIQVVGRGERVHPRKTDAIVIDYREPLVDVLELQWWAREATYNLQGYTIDRSLYSIKLEEDPVAAGA